MKVEKLLLDILSVQSESNKEDRMIFFLETYCNAKGYDVKTINKNVYVTKGTSDNYPCYVAHTDTCAKIIPDDEFTIVSLDEKELAGYNYKKEEFTQVGFDDKIGIFIALKMLNIVDNGKAFFPYAEEIGCVGTRKAEMDFFLDCGYLIQCDRRNAKGIVNSVSGVSLFGDDFKDTLLDVGLKYGRSMTTGMLTDVYTLKTMGLDVACTNLECGYYNPHMDDDYCVVSEVYDTLDFVEDIYQNTKGMRFEHKYEARTYNTSSYYYPNNYGGRQGRYYYDDWYDGDGISAYSQKNNATTYKNGKKLVNGKLYDYCDCCGGYYGLVEHKKVDMYLCPSCENVFSDYI